MKGFAPKRTRPQPHHLYDVAVVGAGLAGCELSWRLSGAGKDVLLVSQALDTLGNLYQPLVRAQDFAPHSLFAQVFAGLNTSEAESWAFHRHLKAALEAESGIHLLQSCVSGIKAQATEVQLSSWEGPPLRARRAVLATGAFLGGRLHAGEAREEAGRLSEVAYDFLRDDLLRQGVALEDECQRSEAPWPYEVHFQVIGKAEFNGFALRRLPNTYALGRCTAGKHTYLSVLRDAAALSAQLTS